METFGNTIQECKAVIGRLKREELLLQRRIQGSEHTVLNAMHDTIPHIELHAGQIVYITRLLLRDSYELRWKPKTKEEGA